MMFFSSRGGYHEVLMGMGACNSNAGRGTDDWGRRTILLILHWFGDDRGRFPFFNLKSSCFVVDRGVCDSMRGNQGSEIWGTNP
jgi:hypothetical protein